MKQSSRKTFILIIDRQIQLTSMLLRRFTACLLSTHIKYHYKLLERPEETYSFYYLRIKMVTFLTKNKLYNLHYNFHELLIKLISNRIYRI